MEDLNVKLRLLKAKFKQQAAFSMNIDMQVASRVTEAEIKELEAIIKECEGQQRELFVSFLRWYINDEMFRKEPDRVTNIVDRFLKETNCG